MKRLLAYLFIVLGLGLVFSVNAKSKNIGEGDFDMDDSTVWYFLEYIKGKKNGQPIAFLVSVDGSFSLYWSCPTSNCSAGDEKSFIKHCEKQANGECKVFARGRYIKWKNGINPGKGKISKISSKLNFNELKSKLTELGFYENKTTTKKIEKKETKKTDSKKQRANDECKELGFTNGTEDFADCVTIMLSKQ